MFMDYSCGVDKIYAKEEIEKVKKSPSFPREYELHIRAYWETSSHIYLLRFAKRLSTTRIIMCKKGRDSGKNDLTISM
jgi:hypothetical protein